MIHFSCQNCRKNFMAKDEQAGHILSCTQCRSQMTVPGPTIPAVVAQPHHPKPMPVDYPPTRSDPFSGLQAEPESIRRGRTVKAWPGEPPGWLIGARIIIWGLVAIPSLILIVLILVGASLGVSLEERGMARLGRASEIVIAVGVAFAADRLISANRY